MTNETVASGSWGESVRVGITILVFVPELVTNEVAIPGTFGKREIPETVEAVFASCVVPTEEAVSDSLWETFSMVLEMGEPASV